MLGAQGLTPPLRIINIIKPKRGGVRHLCFTAFCVSAACRHCPPRCPPLVFYGILRVRRLPPLSTMVSATCVLRHFCVSAAVRHCPPPAFCSLLHVRRCPPRCPPPALYDILRVRRLPLLSTMVSATCVLRPFCASAAVRHLRFAAFCVSAAVHHCPPPAFYSLLRIRHCLPLCPVTHHWKHTEQSVSNCCVTALISIQHQAKGS